MGGLGRGLAAILTGPTERTGTSLRDRFIDSALTSVTAGGQLRLCGYVHTIGEDSELTLRSPDLRSLHPTEAYQLFTKLGEVAHLDIGDHGFTIAGVPANATLTVGTRSHGLFFFGDNALTPEQTTKLASFCRVFAPVIHEHDHPASETERVHLVLDQEGGNAHAEITIDGRVGFGSAPKAHEAVASAALTAISQGAKLVEVGEVRAGDGAAAFVVAAGEQGRLGTGAAPIVAGPDSAAAVAALRAGRALIASANTD